MKIKISKSQWTEMGKQAGWIKKAVSQAEQPLTPEEELLRQDVIKSYLPAKFDMFKGNDGKYHIESLESNSVEGGIINSIEELRNFVSNL